MKIAFIHSERKLQTGAHYINGLMSRELCIRGAVVQHFFPRTTLIDNNIRLKGIQNILFFHSLLEHKSAILRCDLIQGTTYTPLAFLPFSIPVVSHFGSTTQGFLKATPYFWNIEDKQLQHIWLELRSKGVIKELNIKTRRPLHDIADIEIYTAKRAQAIIATSRIVKNDLVQNGAPIERTHLVHNAIEDFWFDNSDNNILRPFGLVFTGRIGSDVFTLELKGFDRLVALYRRFSTLPKLTIAMTPNKHLARYLLSGFENNDVMINALKEQMKERLAQHKGNVFLGVSRYEGFCLSLVEAMSQGIIPVSFPTGVAPEIIRNNENGYIVESIDEMIEKIEKIRDDEGLRVMLGENAQKTALEFRADRMAEQLLGVYKETLFKGR